MAASVQELLRQLGVLRGEEPTEGPGLMSLLPQQEPKPKSQSLDTSEYGMEVNPSPLFDGMPSQLPDDVKVIKPQPGGIFGLLGSTVKNLPEQSLDVPVSRAPASKKPKQSANLPPQDAESLAPAPQSDNAVDFGTNSLANQQDLQAAQQKQSDLQFLANMNRAAAQASQGIARTGKLDTSVADAVEKQSKQPIENYEQQIAFQKQDPNSAYSKGLKDYFKKKLGMEIRGDASAAELEKIMPAAVREYEAKEDRKYKSGEKAIERKHEKELLGMRLKADKAKSEKPLSSKELTTQTRLIRSDLRRGPAGKTYNNFLNADRATRTVEKFLQNPTGYSDYGTLLGGLKALQGDESVVREAEIRLGMDAGSFKDKILNRIEKLRTGKSLQKGQREDILKAVSVLREVTKNQFMEIAEPDLIQAESLGIPRNQILSSVFDKQKQAMEEKDPKIQEYADAYFDGDYDKAKTLLEKRGYGREE